MVPWYERQETPTKENYFLYQLAWAGKVLLAGGDLDISQEGIVCRFTDGMKVELPKGPGFNEMIDYLRANGGRFMH